jgi:hypothetical protein
LWRDWVGNTASVDNRNRLKSCDSASAEYVKLPYVIDRMNYATCKRWLCGCVQSALTPTLGRLAKNRCRDLDELSQRVFWKSPCFGVQGWHDKPCVHGVVIFLCQRNYAPCLRTPLRIKDLRRTNTFQINCWYTHGVVCWFVSVGSLNLCFYKPIEM